MHAPKHEWVISGEKSSPLFSTKHFPRDINLGTGIQFIRRWFRFSLLAPSTTSLTGAKKTINEQISVPSALADCCLIRMSWKEHVEASQRVPPCLRFIYVRKISLFPDSSNYFFWKPNENKHSQIFYGFYRHRSCCYYCKRKKMNCSEWRLGACMNYACWAYGSVMSNTAGFRRSKLSPKPTKINVSMN